MGSMTKKEAEAKLKYHETKPLGWCPLIDETCRRDCVCYKRPEMQPAADPYADEVRYDIGRPSCNHLRIIIYTQEVAVEERGKK